MKKFVERSILLTVLLALLLALPAMANAATSGTCGDNLTWTLDDEGLLTISGTGEMKNCSSCGPWGTEVKEAMIEKGVTSIGNYAFAYCRSLSSISIPDGVINIGSSAFACCSSLSSISIPDGVTSIGSCAFAACSSLSSISIPDGVTSIGDYAFDSCSSLSSISIPEGVTSIGGWAFADCSNLSSISIPEGVTSISEGAFFDCRNLSSISIPEGVTSIGGVAFQGCSSLSSISIPEGVTSIGGWAFADCSSLSSISLPDNIISVGIDIIINCPAVLYTSRNSTTAQTLTEAGYSWVSSGTCGDNLTWTLDDEGLLTISGTGEMWDYDWEYDSASGKYVTTAPWGVEVKEVVLEKGVTSIGDHAFRGCSSLNSISIPEGVISIGSYAFGSCSSLSSISLPESLTSIGSDAFSHSSLSSISIPEGVTSIGECAFHGCSSLSSISIPEGVTSIDYHTFEGCSNLSSISLPEGVTSIEGHAFSLCSSLSSISLPESLTSIGSYAFYVCSSLSSISIPEGVTSIEGHTFFRCHALTSVYIPDSVTSIASDAFTYSYPTIYCYEYSYAETWAKQNGKKYVLLDGKDLNELLTVTLPETMSLSLGEAKPIAYGIFPQLPDMTIVWASSDEDFVTVADGVLTPVGGGSAVVTLTVNGVSASCTVTVAAPATRLALPEDIYVTAKTTSALPLTIEPAGATCQLVYTTGDSVYALISTDGVVTAGAVGSTPVPVTDQLTGLNASATIRICRPASQVSFAEASCTAHPGDVLQLTVNVTSGSQSLINALVTFASSDESIAAVDQNGRLTAKAPGTVTITATASNGVSDSCTVTVKALVRSVLPAGLTSLDSEALTGIAAEWIVLPEGMQTIGSRAFAGCGSLVRVEIPASVTSIADDAFADCGALTIVAPEGSTAHTFAVGHEFNWTDK